MANLLVAGNSTNGGTAITTDTSGTLNIVTGSGSGSTAVTVDGSGNMVVTGTLTASGGVSGGIRSGTAVASTSGTSIDFTSIPSGVKRITVNFSGVSTNGTNIPIIQLGYSGGVETSGYLSTGSSVFAASACTAASQTTGFGIGAGMAATVIFHGAIQITLLNASTNTWCANGVLARSDVASVWNCSGAKSLSGTLDRIRITTVNGTDTFDAGSINILYE